jgi:parallel beta-helix repeat protein
MDGTAERPAPVQPGTAQHNPASTKPMQVAAATRIQGGPTQLTPPAATTMLPPVQTAVDYAKAAPQSIPALSPSPPMPRTELLLAVPPEVGPEDAAPGKVFRLSLIVVLAVFLLGGLGYGAYHLWRLFAQTDPVPVVKKKPPIKKPDPTKPTKKEPVVGPIITVSPRGDGQFRTIREALEKAGPGMRILVNPGTYRESLVLAKNVEIIGNGPTAEVVIENADFHCLDVQTETALVRGLTLRVRAGSPAAHAVKIGRGRLTLEDCDLGGDSPACLLIGGRTTRPLVHNCRVHGGTQTGIQVEDQAEPVLEGCQVFDNGTGVVIRTAANPSLEGCKIHDNRQHGLVVIAQGRGKGAGGEVYANGSAGIWVESGGDPSLRQWTIRDGRAAGVLVGARGRGTFEHCDVHGNAQAGVEIRQGGHPTFRAHCDMHDGAGPGILVHQQGAGTFADCAIFRNRQAGVEIQGGGNPSLHGCTIRDGQGIGLLVTNQGRGRLTQCTITRNTGYEVAVRNQGNPVMEDCTVRESTGFGIHVADNGRGTFTNVNVLDIDNVGVTIQGGGDPALTRVTIHRGKGFGLIIKEKAKGTVRNCDVTGHPIWEVVIMGESTPTLENCTIHGGHELNVIIGEGARPRLLGCESVGARYGMVITSGADPYMHKCRIRGAQYHGIQVHGKGKGTVDACLIDDNLHCGVALHGSDGTLIKNCKIRGNGVVGIGGYAPGTATVTGCDLTRNKKGPFDIRVECRVTGSGNRLR